MLVVEDDEQMRVLLTALLEQAGHRVRTAANGRAALAELDRQAPDLILLDAVMPVMDGPALVRQLKNREDTSHIPILIVSGHSEYALAATITLGAEGFLAKPFEADRLLELIEELTPRPSP